MAMTMTVVIAEREGMWMGTMSVPGEQTQTYTYGSEAEARGALRRCIGAAVDLLDEGRVTGFTATARTRRRSKREASHA